MSRLTDNIDTYIWDPDKQWDLSGDTGYPAWLRLKTIWCCIVVVIIVVVVVVVVVY